MADEKNVVKTTTTKTTTTKAATPKTKTTTTKAASKKTTTKNSATTTKKSATSQTKTKAPAKKSSAKVTISKEETPTAPVENKITEPVILSPLIEDEVPKKEETNQFEKTVALEELKIDKRFCTKCGRELNKDELCSCSTITPNQYQTEFSKLTEEFSNCLLNMFTKPDCTIEERLNSPKINLSMIILIAIAITSGLCITSVFSKVIDIYNILATGISGAISSIPYFIRIFLPLTVINFLTLFIPIIIAYVISKIMNKKDYTFTKSLNLYATCFAPTIIANLFMALLYFLDFLPLIGLVFGLAINIYCFFNYIFGYIKSINLSESKKSLTISAFVIMWLAVSLLINVLFLPNLITSVAGDLKIQPYNERLN